MAKEPYPSETADRFIVRFPDGMRDRLKDLAKANGRSLNAQIVHMLEWSLDEMALSAGAYGKPAPLTHEQADTVKFLRQELRRNQHILEKILKDVVEGKVSIEEVKKSKE